MQKRPDLYNKYNLKKHFIGKTLMGSWKVWISLGNYLDFQGSRNNLHQHSFFEVCLVLDGKGTLFHNERSYTLQKGDLFVTSPGIIHEIVSDKIYSLKIQFLYFSLGKVTGEMEDEATILYDRFITAFVDNHKIVSGNSEELETQFHKLKIISEESNHGKWFLQNETLARNLILDVILKSVKNNFAREESSDIDSRLQMALRFMKDNACRKLSVREISEQACTSPRTLRRLMKDFCNETVVQKSFKVRIKESAQYLIAHREKTIAEVSYIFNFKNPSDFGRGFKEIMKVSPGRFRENDGTSFIN
jgi:AraC family transcriptional regulator, arabinose operon regulatory protein